MRLKARRPKLWPPSYLRYLLIWPLVRAYRRKTRTRLAWRLAGSHIATVLVSVAVICVITIAIALIGAKLTLAWYSEASFEAMDAAKMLQKADPNGHLSPSETSGILTAIASGGLTYNDGSDVRVSATVGFVFAHVASVSVVDPTGIVTASSKSALIGRSLAVTDPDAMPIVARAIAASSQPDMNALTIERDPGRGTAGTYPLRDPDGAIVGAILLDKTQSSIPGGWGLVHLLALYVLQLGTFLLFLVGVPAIPVGIVIGIRRGRAISRPIANLAAAADSLAAGDFDARVCPLPGANEITSLQHGFNHMVELIRTSMTKESAHRERAEQALAANRDLIANVSHELRTPVALIRGHLEALEDDPSESAAYLRIALGETDRLERLVEELFQLSRLEAHQVQLDIAPFDAGAAIRAAIESLAEPARREAGLTLTAATGDGDLSCLGDRLRTEQVLLNLIRNAIHFTPEGGIVLATAERAGSVVRLVVRDTGIGIAPDDLPYVFDRFYRADHSRVRSGGGAGLGLAIAREFVLAMDGTIAVDSVPDEGTIFTIELPVAHPDRQLTMPSKADPNGVRMP